MADTVNGKPAPLPPPSQPLRGREILANASEFESVFKQYRSAILLVVALSILGILNETGMVSAQTAFAAASLSAIALVVIDNLYRINVDNFAADRTQHKHSESHRASMSTAQIVAALPDPAVLLDRSFTIIEHNAAAESLFGKAIHGLALEHVSRDPELITSVTIVLNAGERKTVRLAWLGAIERHLLATISPVGNRANGTLASSANAEPEFVLITIKDLSDQHRLLEMRTDFIANASHELRTPLASVRGFIETLQGPARDDPAARTRFLGIMAAQAERMTRLIDDLLLLSRVEEKAYLAPTGRVDLDEVIADVVRTLLPIADERRVSIIVQRTELAGQVVGERDEIFQVFQNLIENAVKYGRDGGMVTVARTKADGATSPIPRTTITISDDGPGIAPEHLPRLTERFYRVNADQSRKIGGTGLGLAIVKHVLNRHQGELQIVSTVGVGTTVRVTLPIRIR